MCISGAITVKSIGEAMSKANEKRDTQLGRCDDAFFKGQENIEGSLFAFIKSNRNKFVFK